MGGAGGSLLFLIFGLFLPVKQAQFTGSEGLEDRGHRLL